MPGLVLCNRRWGIGSDDLACPALGELVLRVVWLLVIAVVYGLHQSTLFDCQDGYLLQTYYIGCLVITSINIVLGLLIIYTATQGTITNSWPRKKMPKYMYMKFVLAVPEVTWNILGSCWSFGESSGCEEHVVITVKAAVIFGWIMGVLVMIGVACVFDPLGKLSAGKSAQQGASRERRQSGASDSISEFDELTSVMQGTSQIWEKRCRLLCCCIRCDDQNNDAFTDIGKLLSLYFQDIDLVPTDIAAGLILIQAEQENQTHDLHTVTIDSIDSPSQVPETVLGSQIVTLQTTDINQAPSYINGTQESQHLRPKDWMTVDMAHHFMKFASAVYGWPLFVFAHPCTGPCLLFGECRCCSCTTSIEHDNCCQCHGATIKNMLGVYDDDIIYASYHNKIFETPFCVILDHEKKAVVVALRGTLSLRDALTDMIAHCDGVHIEGVDGDCLCHRGMLQAAIFIKNKLENNAVLATAFERVQGYRLVITGHSLGAGTAALLAILLKPAYPDLWCFSFSPPGGLVSTAVAKYSESFIMSVALGKDLVPRLGILPMEDLKVKLLRNLRDSEKSKYQILAGGCLPSLCCSRNNENRGSSRHLLENSSSGSNLRYSTSQANLEQEHTKVTGIEQALQDAIMHTGHSRITHTPLYPPGQILYITEAEPSSSCSGTPTYEVKWSKAKIFTEIIVSPKMISDHLPDNVLKALEQLKEQDLSPRHLIVHSTLRPPPRTNGTLPDNQNQNVNPSV